MSWLVFFFTLRVVALRKILLMSQMIKRGVNIYVDQTEAAKALEMLQIRFESLTQDMRKLEAEGKKGNTTWQSLDRNLKKVDSQLKEVSSEVKLTELSMKQLYTIKSRLNSQLKNSKPESEQWKKYANSIQVVDIRLEELRRGAKATDGVIKQLDNTAKAHQSTMGKLADKFNKYQALAIGFVASITGITFAIKNVTREYAKLDDVFANVSKNTGLPIEEVRELDEQLQNYDTRTAREELLKLASEAGKAGEEGVENLEGIVQSLDKVKVALGEDLGEDAITDLLKIANVSGLRELMGTADAINSIGSAVNELGQKSVAKEAYIISFTQRLGGVSTQANISAQNIMGFASALDQAGMNVEMASTAVQQFLMKMLEDPAKFAKIAGLEIKSFTELVAKDTNAALIQMLEAMKAKGGFQALIPMFSEMGTEGVRAVSVLSSLAGQIDSVKEAQILSNKAFSEGTSLQAEYDKKNNNAQAELDKRKKAFLENAVALGEKLYPAMKMSLSGASYLIKAIGFLINNFWALTPLIGACTVALIAYNKQKIVTWALDVKSTLQAYKWMLAETIKQSLIGKTTMLTRAAAIAQAIWNTAISATGVGGFIILLGSLATTLLLVTGAFDKTTKAQKALNEAQKATNDQMADEKARIEVLIAQINNENLSREERNKKLKELIAIAPEYLNKLTLDNIKTAEGTNIIKEYIKQLERKIHLQNLEKELANADKEVERAKSGESLWWLQKFNDKEGWIKKETEDAQKVYDDIKKKIESYIISNPINVSKIEDDNSVFTPQDKDKKPWEKAIKTLEDGLNRSKAINEKALLDKVITEEQYNRMNLENDLKFHNDKLNILKKYKQATGDVELDIAKTKANQQKLSYNQEIDELIDNKNQYLLELEKKYSQGIINQNGYNLNIIASEVATLEKRLVIMKKYGDNTINLERDILQKRRDLWEAFKVENEKEVEDENENPALGEDIKLKIEAIFIQNQYKKNLINKQEYEDKMLEIARKRFENEYKYYLEYSDNVNKLSAEGLKSAENFKEASLTNTETNYNKEINALDNKLERELITQEQYDLEKKALETKYQEEQKEIKKKYAGVELALNIAQIISSTALAVMNSLKMGFPWSIPFGIMAGVQGAAQIALAKAQYNQIQGLEEGLYPVVTRKQDGKQFSVSHVGNMSTGVYNKPSVLVGEAGPELVVDNKRFRRIMRDNPQVIDYIVNGFEGGKYPSFSKEAINIGSNSQNKVIEQNTKVMKEFMDILNSSSIYGFREKLNKADKTINKIHNKFK